MTRFGVFADVHANLHALDAVLAHLARERVDAYICAGDLVGYGALPNECVARVAALPGVCVAGNHDLIVLGELSTERCIPLASESLEWTTRCLTPASRQTLLALPRRADAERVAVAHGSLQDPEEYVRDTGRALAQLRLLGDQDEHAQILVLGHTHEPLAVGERRGELLRHDAGKVTLLPGERHLLNPGSAGQSRGRNPRARALVLDTARGEARFLELDYDSRGARRALRRAGLPSWSAHLSPTRAARVRRKLSVRWR